MNAPSPSTAGPKLRAVPTAEDEKGKIASKFMIIDAQRRLLERRAGVASPEGKKKKRAQKKAKICASIRSWNSRSIAITGPRRKKKRKEENPGQRLVALGHQIHQFRREVTCRGGARQGGEGGRRRGKGEIIENRPSWYLSRGTAIHGG